MKTDYKFGFFDAQIILVTNYHLLKSRGRLTREQLVTSFCQSIIKYTRDICNCDKVILLWDKGPYHRSKLLVDHKGDRFYVTDKVVQEYSETKPITEWEQRSYIQELIKTHQGTQDELDEKIKTFNETHPTLEQYQEKLKYLQKEARNEEIKNQTKYWIINNLGKIGLPSLIYDGYEADDLANICSLIAYEECLKSDDKRSSYICSKDSDWRYLLKPGQEVMRYHRNTMESYNQVYNEIPEVLRRRGVGLYLYKSVIDSLRGSHNHLFDCRKDNAEVNLVNFFDHLNDREWLEQFCDSDLFLPQLASFDFKKFPDYKEVYEDIRSSLLSNSLGSLMKNEDFRIFSERNGINMSESYYEKFKNIINSETYSVTETEAPIDLDKILESI